MDWKEKMQNIASTVREKDDFVVIHHYDADGCSSGAIMVKALEREGKKVTKKWVKQLYKETTEEIKGLGENYVFVDFGSAQLDYLIEEFGDNLFVFDHHEKTKTDHPNHFSPFNHGINGGNEISASGIAYLFAKTLNEKNSDLIPLAIVGAIGDMQDFQGSLVGMNAEILKEGIEKNLIVVEKDLKLYGRVTRPLTSFLMFSSSPMLPELTANEENCVRFLRETGIDLKRGETWRTYIDLSLEERKKLSTALILHLYKFNVPEWKIKELIGDVYTFPNENRKSPLSDVKEFSTLLNACLVPGTKVYLNGAPKEIEQIKRGKVFSSHKQKISKQKIVSSHKVRLPKIVDVLEITTQTGKKISLTENHELMSLLDSEPIWIPSRKIKVGDYIATSKKIPWTKQQITFADFFKEEELVKIGSKWRLPKTIVGIKKPKFDENLGFLIGYVAGDGSIKNGLDIVFSRKPQDIKSFEILKEIISTQFGLDKFYVSNKPTFFNVQWSSKTFEEFLKRVGIKKRKTTSVSFNYKLLKLDKGFTKGIVRGVFSSDGTVNANNLELSSHSKILIDQTSYLLQKFGIVSHTSFAICNDCGKNKHRLFITGKEDLINYSKNIDFSDSDRSEKLKTVINSISDQQSNVEKIPVNKKLIKLGELLGISRKWAANFSLYKNKVTPTKNNISKYVSYYENKIDACENVLIDSNIKKSLKTFKISKTKFCLDILSRVWLRKIISGKKPKKNAKLKLEKCFLRLESQLIEAKKLIQELKEFTESDLYWDTVKEVRKQYTRPKFVYDLTIENTHNYFANGVLVHNCGRHGQAEIGIEVCLGDRGEFLMTAMSLMQEHRRQLRQGIEFVIANGVLEEENFYFFDSGSEIKDSIVGIVAGMLYGSGTIENNKPIIAIAQNDDASLKLSGRATKELLQRGLNLGLAFREICNELGEGNEGGGHGIAAGVKLEKKNKDIFLKLLNQKIAEQYNHTT
ncbi:MAG: DHHA1 domain-containing protein [archaeon]|nr:DHHA1 domain-containing protein [archaeon]